MVRLSFPHAAAVAVAIASGRSRLLVVKGSFPVEHAQIPKTQRHDQTGLSQRLPKKTMLPTGATNMASTTPKLGPRIPPKQKESGCLKRIYMSKRHSSVCKARAFTSAPQRVCGVRLSTQCLQTQIRVHAFFHIEIRTVI